MLSEPSSGQREWRRHWTWALGRWLRQPYREMLTTLHVLALMVVVELLIRTVSLPRLARTLGCRVDLTVGEPGAQRLPLKSLPRTARRQVTCTRRVADAWPFSKGPCLRRALVAGRLLRDLEPSIRLGISTAGGEPHAHAWLEIDGRPLENVAAYLPFERRPQVGGCA